MFNQDDILIIGDSFAYERVIPQSWPRILTELLVKNNLFKIPRGKGFPGCSWWSVRQNLIEELKNGVPKVLILCHTEPNRIPSDYDFPLNIKSVEDLKHHIGDVSQYKNVITPSHIKEVQTAALMYYQFLFNPDYHEWAQNQWCRELDEIIGEHDIPYVIHLHCFEIQNNYIFKNGITAEETLWENSAGYQIFKNNPENRFDKKIQYELMNHFSTEENLKLANCLYNSILTYSTGKRKIGF